MKKIIIIGAGAMGSAFAVPCIENKNEVSIVGTHLENELIDNINSNNKIHPVLKTQLPKEIKFEKFDKLQLILKQDKNSRSIRFCKFVPNKNYAEKLPVSHKI